MIHAGKVDAAVVRFDSFRGWIGTHDRRRGSHGSRASKYRNRKHPSEQPHRKLPRLKVTAEKIVCDHAFVVMTCGLDNLLLGTMEGGATGLSIDDDGYIE
jgi:hypothetical protein